MEDQLLAKLKECSKDEAAYRKLRDLFTELSEDLDRYKTYLNLLERSIRNDFDSILITELDLEEPGPSIVYVNDGFTRITGYSREEVIGKSPRILQGEKTDPSVLKSMKRRLQQGLPFFGHAINYRKDGTEFVNQWDIHPLLDESGELTHWVSYQHDVTERKRSEKALLDAKLEFDNLHEEAKTIRADLGSGGEFLSANKAFREMTGYHLEELQGMKLSDLLEGDEKSRIEELFNSFRPEEFDGVQWTLTLAGRSGLPIEVEVNAGLLSSDGNQIVRLRFRNRSLQKRIVNMLKTRPLLNQKLGRKSDFEYRITERDGELVWIWVSESFINITGIQSDEIVDRPVRELVPPDEWSRVESFLRKVFKHGFGSETYQIRTKGGVPLPVIDSAKVYRSENGAADIIRGSVVVSSGK